MVTQVLGVLLSITGILWFFFTLTIDRAGQQQPVLSLWGVVTFLGGLILWALGRIECALSPPGEQKKGSERLSLILLIMIVLLPIALAFFRFLSSSPPSVDQARPGPAAKEPPPGGRERLPVEGEK
jgi:hypothetical protein